MAKEKPRYVVREVPASRRSPQQKCVMMKGEDGVFHIERETLPPEGRQFDVFMRSNTSVRYTEKEFEEFERRENPLVDEEQEMLNVFVGSEYVSTGGV